MDMNHDINNPGFVYIRYSLGEIETQISELKLIIPNIKGESNTTYDLFPQFTQIKEKLRQVQRKDINKQIEMLKEAANKEILQNNKGY